MTSHTLVFNCTNFANIYLINLKYICFVFRSAIESVWAMIVGHSNDDVEASRRERMRRSCIVVVWFASSLVIALLVPNIGVVISLLGGLAALFAFVLPGQ